jgi:hypothetical protein
VDGNKKKIDRSMCDELDLLILFALVVDDFTAISNFIA